LNENDTLIYTSMQATFRGMWAFVCLFFEGQLSRRNSWIIRLSTWPSRTCAQTVQITTPLASKIPFATAPSLANDPNGAQRFPRPQRRRVLPFAPRTAVDLIVEFLFSIVKCKSNFLNKYCFSLILSQTFLNAIRNNVDFFSSIHWFIFLFSASNMTIMGGESCKRVQLLLPVAHSKTLVIAYHI